MSWPDVGPTVPATSRVGNSRCWPWPWHCCPAPSLLLIDELSLGLAPLVVERLLDSVRALRSAGTSVLLVEQSVNVAVAVADRVVVMDSGAIRFSGTAAEVRDHPELLWSIFLRRAASRVGPTAGRRSPGRPPRTDTTRRGRTARRHWRSAGSP